MRASYNGSTMVSKTICVGSIPTARATTNRREGGFLLFYEYEKDCESE